MNPFKLYFAGAWAGGGDGEVNVYEAGVRNKLVSFMYPTQLTGWLNCLPSQEEGSIMLDSGAFTAWNSGKFIDLSAYIAYAKQTKDTCEERLPNQQLYVVNLDVIPGQAGQTQALSRSTSTSTLVEDAAKAGFKNMKRMLKEGVTPIHVFHQGERFEWIDRITEYVQYIGVSPANDMPTRAKYNWMQSVFEYLYKKNIDVNTHGFAVTSIRAMLSFPWTSTDSATWRIAAGMGSLFYPGGRGFSNPSYAVSGNYSVSDRKKGKESLSPLFLKYLQDDGYSYEDIQTWKGRTKINIRYFLGLEKWINEQRSQMVFKPRSGFNIY